MWQIKPIRLIPKILGVGSGLIVLYLCSKYFDTNYLMTGTIPKPIVHPVLSFISFLIVLIAILLIIFSENMQHRQ